VTYEERQERYFRCIIFLKYFKVVFFTTATTTAAAAAAAATATATAAAAATTTAAAAAAIDMGSIFFVLCVLVSGTECRAFQ